MPDEENRPLGSFRNTHIPATLPAGDDGPGADDDTQAAPTTAPRDTGDSGHPDDGGPRGAAVPPEPRDKGDGDESKAGDKADTRRFKDHDAAEKGYKHLQSTLTKAQQELKDAKAKLKAYEDGKRRLERFEKRTDDLTAFTKDLHKKTSAAVDALDPDDPEYRDKSADIWADHYRAIERKRFELGEAATDTEGGDEAARTDPAPVAPDPTAEPDPVLMAELSGMIAAADLVETDPVLFGYIQQSEPIDAAGNPVTPQEQMRIAIDKTLKYKADLAAKYKQARQPMGRGGTRPAEPPDEPAAPETLGSYIKRARRRKR